MEIRGRDRAAAIERLESVLCARDNEYLYIGYATQMRAELPRRARDLADGRTTPILHADAGRCMTMRACPPAQPMPIAARST
jgi:hypothetical protein